jgi:hypothetical protein
MLPRIVFHHVNKCAGTTLLKFLEGTTPHERAAHLETLVAGQGGDPTGTGARAAILRAEFLHDPYGIHDWKALLGNTLDVIFLRDPVARLHSEWRMITRWDDALVASRDDRYRRLRAVVHQLAVPAEKFLADSHLVLGKDRRQGLAGQETTEKERRVGAGATALGQFGPERDGFTAVSPQQQRLGPMGPQNH